MRGHIPRGEAPQRVEHELRARNTAGEASGMNAPAVRTELFGEPLHLGAVDVDHEQHVRAEPLEVIPFRK